jgi:hypothetical protein
VKPEGCPREKLGPKGGQVSRDVVPGAAAPECLDPGNCSKEN